MQTPDRNSNVSMLQNVTVRCHASLIVFIYHNVLSSGWFSDGFFGFIIQRRRWRGGRSERRRSGRIRRKRNCSWRGKRGSRRGRKKKKQMVMMHCSVDRQSLLLLHRSFSISLLRRLHIQRATTAYTARIQPIPCCGCLLAQNPCRVLCILDIGFLLLLSLMQILQYAPQCLDILFG